MGLLQLNDQRAPKCPVGNVVPLPRRSSVISSCVLSRVENRSLRDDVHGKHSGVPKVQQPFCSFSRQRKLLHSCARCSVSHGSVSLESKTAGRGGKDIEKGETEKSPKLGTVI